MQNKLFAIIDTMTEDAEAVKLKKVKRIHARQNLMTGIRSK